MTTRLSHLSERSMETSRADESRGNIVIDDASPAHDLTTVDTAESPVARRSSTPRRTRPSSQCHAERSHHDRPPSPVSFRERDGCSTVHDLAGETRRAGSYDGGENGILRRRSRLDDRRAEPRWDDRPRGTDADRRRYYSSPPTNRPSRPATLRLPEFDGSTSLQTFLIKYRNCKQYYEWSPRQSTSHLRQALVGEASSILWGTGADSGEEELIRALQKRYGTECQTEKNRQLLKAKRQNRGESIREHFAEILRLVQLSFSNCQNEMTELIAKDYFVDGLFDTSIRLRVAEACHRNIFDAYEHATRLEAITDSIGSERKFARTMRLDQPHDETSLRMSQLESRLDRLTASVQKLADGQQGPDRSLPTKRQEADCPQQQPTATSRGRRTRRCYRCGSEKHLIADCMSKTAESNKQEAGAKINQVGDQTRDSSHYLKAHLIKGSRSCEINFILDSGANRSIISDKYLKWCSGKLQKCDVKVYTASGEKIDVIGQAPITFDIDGERFTEICLVTKYVDESLLSMQWLARNKIIWHLADEYIVIRGRRVGLHSRPAIATVRRVIVAQNMTILPGHIGFAPVRMPHHTLVDNQADWLIEPALIKQTALSPRTVLCDKAENMIQICNVSDEAVHLTDGLFVANACMLDVAENRTKSTADRIWSTRAVFNQPEDTNLNRLPGNHNDAPVVRMVKTSSDSHVSDAAVVCSSSDGPTNVAGNILTDQKQENEAKPVITEQQLGMIEEMMTTVPDDVDDNDRQAIRELLTEFIHLFATHPLDSGTTDWVECDIRLSDPQVRPVCQRLRRYPTHIAALIDKEVAALERAGVVEKADPTWCSNLIAVAKKVAQNEPPKVRIACDLRIPNKHVAKSCFPLPSHEKLLNHLAGCERLIKLDFCASFYAIKVNEKSRDVLGFRTESNTWRYCKVPFGFINSTAVYSKLMCRLLEVINLENVLSYVDDLTVGCQNIKHGLVCLRRIFEAVEKAGIRFSHQKCAFFTREADILGWRFSSGVLTQLPERVLAIQKLQCPKNKKELRAMIGGLQYTRASYKNLAVFLSKFTDALRGKEPFKQTPELLEAFKRLKEELAQAVALNVLDATKTIVLQTDASHGFWSGVLMYETENKERKICSFASGKFCPQQRKLCILQKELIGVLNTLRRYRHQILGSRIVLETDSQTLSWLLKSPNLSDKLLRHVQYINDFNIELRHVRTFENKLADLFTRGTIDVDDGDSASCEIDNLCRRCAPTADMVRVVSTCKKSVNGRSVNNAVKIGIGDRQRAQRTRSYRRASDRLSRTTENIALTDKLAFAEAGRLNSWSAQQKCTGDTTADTAASFVQPQPGAMPLDRGHGKASEISAENMGRAEYVETGNTTVHSGGEGCSTALATTGEQNADGIGTDLVMTGGVTKVDAINEQTLTERASLNLPSAVQMTAIRSHVATAEDSQNAALTDLAVQPKNNETVTQTAVSTGDVISTNHEQSAGQCDPKQRNRHRRKVTADSTKTCTEEKMAVDAIDKLLKLDKDAADSDRNCEQQKLCIKGVDVTVVENPVHINAIDIATVDKIRFVTRAQTKQLQQQATAHQQKNGLLVPNVNTDTPWSASFLRDQQEKDPIVSKILHHVENKTRLSNEDLDDNDEFCSYHYQWEALCVINKILYKRYYTEEGRVAHLQYVVPKILQNEIMQRIHVQDLAHARCVKKNLHALRRLAFWYQMRRDLVSFLALCINCAEAYSRKENPVGPISTTVRTTRPQQKLAIDLVGPLPKSDHHSYILSAMDCFSKKIWLFPLRSREASEIAEHIVFIFLTEGPFQVLFCDNGKELVGRVLSGICDVFGTSRSQSLFYSPRQNPVEKFHRNLHQLLTRSLVGHKDWSRLLLGIQCAYNNTQNSVTKYTPNFLHSGRHTATYTSALLAAPEQIDETYGQFAARISDDLQRAFKITHDNLKKAATLNQERYNRHKKPPEFVQGQTVLLFSPRVRQGELKKWKRYWSTRAEIVERLNSYLYVVRPLPGRRKFVVYVDKLRALPVEEASNDQNLR